MAKQRTRELEVPVRQWVLTFAYPLRFVLANDRRRILRALVRAGRLRVAEGGGGWLRAGAP